MAGGIRGSAAVRSPDDERGELVAEPCPVAGHAPDEPGTESRGERCGIDREPRELRQLLQVVGDCARIDLDRQRLAVGDAHRHACGVLRFDIIGRQRVDRSRELTARFAVDQGVMNLGVERKAARWHARYVVQTFDYVCLPERLAAIERPRVQARNLDAELAPVARLRQRDVPHVELDVELGILDPPGPIEHPRHRDEPATEMRKALDACREEPQDVLEPHLAAGCGGGVIDPEPGDVHEVVAAFELQERVIEPGQLSHARTLRGHPFMRRNAARRDPNTGAVHAHRSC